MGETAGACKMMDFVQQQPKQQTQQQSIKVQCNTPNSHGEFFPFFCGCYSLVSI